MHSRTKVKKGLEIKGHPEPKVTVLMSVYNGERFLKESIDSILSQSFKDFEFIIINDGSNDNTRNLLESYNDRRIVLIHQENSGLTKSLNRGLALCKGKYIARMDADDVSERERLTRQVEFLDRHSSVGLLGINGYIIDEKGEVISEVGHPVSHDEIMTKILLDNRFIHSSVMIRKSIFEKYGIYNEEMIMGQDYELVLRLATVTKFANLDERLHKWRKNSVSGISVATRDEQINVRDKIRRAYLKKISNINADFINWIISNFRNDPKDPVLFECLSRILKKLPVNLIFINFRFKLLFLLAKSRVLTSIEDIIRIL